MRPTQQPPTRPFIGHGVGLRRRHYERALRDGLPVDWVEVISENHFGGGGRPAAIVERLRRDMPIVFHGVSLGIASAVAPREDYLAALAELSRRYEPAWMSDHLCWSRREDAGGHHHSHDLLPFAYTRETLDFVVSRVSQVQDRLARPLILENPSSYIGFVREDMGEAEFLDELCRRSGCRLLLDLNNIVVCAKNHGVDVHAYIERISPEFVWQFHLANHTDRGHYKFDDHRGPVPEDVWSLYRRALVRFGPVSSLIEWDSDVPEWSELAAQRDMAARIAQETVSDGIVQVHTTYAAPVQSQTVPPPVQLCEMQDLFWRAMVWPTGVAGYLEQASGTERLAFDATFAGSEIFSATSRAEIYAQAYYWRLHAVLVEQFSTVARGLDEANLRNLITDYVLAHPSQHEDLGRFGERLPDFIARHRVSADCPWLADFARVDAALVDIVDAPDEELLTVEQLTRIPPANWAQLRFSLAATTRLLETNWDYSAATRGGDDPARDARPTQDAGQTLVWRSGMLACHRRPAADESLALGLVARGRTFAELCACTHGENADGEPSDAAARAVTWLRRWLDEGLLAALAAP